MLRAATVLSIFSILSFFVLLFEYDVGHAKIAELVGESDSSYHQLTCDSDSDNDYALPTSELCLTASDGGVAIREYSSVLLLSPIASSTFIRGPPVNLS